MPKAELIFKEDPAREEVRDFEDRQCAFDVTATGASNRRALAICQVNAGMGLTNSRPASPSLSVLAFLIHTTRHRSL
jgi:hypothetical protein